MPGKGRATGYSDYYRGNSQTTEDEEREKEYSINVSMSMPRKMAGHKEDMEAADKKKAAIKRRLQKMRAGK